MDSSSKDSKTSNPKWHDKTQQPNFAKGCLYALALNGLLVLLAFLAFQIIKPLLEQMP